MFRLAKRNDIDAIKKIADANRDTLGFVLRSALQKGIERGWVLVTTDNNTITGFVHFRLRKDAQITIYEICIDAKYRGKGYGKQLIDAVIDIGRRNNKRILCLKCTIDNHKANEFYRHLGFEAVSKERGKRRQLVVWCKKI